MDEIKRGAEAAMILEHSLVRQAFRSFRENIAQQRAKAPMKDTDMHTRLIMVEQVANAFETWFRDQIETGKMAKLQLREPALRVFRR